MMIPVQMGIIPLYMIMVQLGWQNRLQAVIVPFLVSAFGVFMMRQYAERSVPDELIEAARIDGCSTFRIYLTVVLPALRPGASVLALFTFMSTWNEFLWPIAVPGERQPDRAVLPEPAVHELLHRLHADVRGRARRLVPLLLVFLAFGKQIIGGIMEGAVRS